MRNFDVLILVGFIVVSARSLQTSESEILEPAETIVHRVGSADDLESALSKANALVESTSEELKPERKKDSTPATHNVVTVDGKKNAVTSDGKIVVSSTPADIELSAKALRGHSEFATRPKFNSPEEDKMRKELQHLVAAWQEASKDNQASKSALEKHNKIVSKWNVDYDKLITKLKKVMKKARDKIEENLSKSIAVDLLKAKKIWKVRTEEQDKKWDKVKQLESLREKELDDLEKDMLKQTKDYKSTKKETVREALKPHEDWEKSVEQHASQLREDVNEAKAHRDKAIKELNKVTEKYKEMLLQVKKAKHLSERIVTKRESAKTDLEQTMEDTDEDIEATEKKVLDKVETLKGKALEGKALEGEALDAKKILEIAKKAGKDVVENVIN